MDIYEFVSAAKAYQGLGWAVQEQLDDLLGGETDQNPNAVRMIEQFVENDLPKSVDAEELSDAIATFQTQREGA